LVTAHHRSAEGVGDAVAPGIAGRALDSDFIVAMLDEVEAQ
jgi:hypothetical protein